MYHLWYMHKAGSVLEYETHEILWDFEIQTYPLIQAKRPGRLIINKKRTCKIEDFVFPMDLWVKIRKSEKRDKYLSLAGEQK